MFQGLTTRLLLRIGIHGGSCFEAKFEWRIVLIWIGQPKNKLLSALLRHSKPHTYPWRIEQRYLVIHIFGIRIRLNHWWRIPARTDVRKTNQKLIPSQLIRKGTNWLINLYLEMSHERFIENWAGRIINMGIHGYTHKETHESPFYK